MPSADSIWQDLQRSFKEELNPASYSASKYPAIFINLIGKKI